LWERGCPKPLGFNQGKSFNSKIKSALSRPSGTLSRKRERGRQALLSVMEQEMEDTSSGNGDETANNLKWEKG